MTKQFSAAVEKVSAIATLFLGWSPDQFWMATPQELITSLNLLQDQDRKGQDPLDASQLQKLKEQFPDG